MPLSLVTPSTIGSAYLTDTAAAGGVPVWVEWTDWSSRTKKVKSVAFGLDGYPYVSRVGVGQKGYMTLVIPSCPQALYSALQAFVNDGTQRTATLYHATLGTVARTVEVLDVLAPADEQFVSGEPVENVTVRMVAFAAA